MIRMDMGDGSTVFVIEPTNVRKLKQGQPLIIAKNICIMFTPDLEAFSKALINKFPDPPKDQMAELLVDIDAETISKAFEACKYLPEVER